MDRVVLPNRMLRDADLLKVRDGPFGETIDTFECFALAVCDQLSEIAAGLGAQTPTGRLADAKLGAPSPRPANSFGIGLNYKAHAHETGADVPTSPVVFMKPSTA